MPNDRMPHLAPRPIRRFRLRSLSYGGHVAPRNDTSRHPPRMRGIQYAAASRLYRCCLWNTGSPAGACHRAAIRPTRWRAMTTEGVALAFDKTHLRIPAARFARALQIVSPIEKRARGMPGACCTHGLACKIAHRKRTRAYRYSRSIPAFPAQWFYGLCRALPGDEFVLSPSSAD
jgi:hypothetical protein